VGVGVNVLVGFGVIVGADVGMGVVFALPHPTKPVRNNNEDNKMPALKNTFFCFILISFRGSLPPNGMAQRRAAGRDMRGRATQLSRSMPSGGAGRPSAGAGVGRSLDFLLILPSCHLVVKEFAYHLVHQ
jgi:hypothetical protein